MPRCRACACRAAEISSTGMGVGRILPGEDSQILLRINERDGIKRCCVHMDARRAQGGTRLRGMRGGPSHWVSSGTGVQCATALPTETMG